MRGPDPIPIGRARLKQSIFNLFYEHFDNYDGGSAAGTPFPPTHQYSIGFTINFDMSDLHSGLSCPETVNPTTFLKSQPLSQPFSQPFSQPLSQPFNQQLSQPLS